MCSSFGFEHWFPSWLLDLSFSVTSAHFSSVMEHLALSLMVLNTTDKRMTPNLNHQADSFPECLTANPTFFLLLSFLNFYFILQCSWFTMLCQFQVFSKVIQWYVYFLDSFSILVITEYWVAFPVLYSRFLLITYFVCLSVIFFWICPLG